MRLAIPTYDVYVAAVADFSDTLLLVDVEGNREVGRKKVGFELPIVPAKVAVLDDNNVDTLICGAVSRPFAAMVIHYGIELVPFISGSVEDVLNAYLRGSLNDPRFLMPGHSRGMRWCSGRRCRRHGRFR
jgi:predicted Fe-Mo cluster-binding NifX family protein